MATPTKPHPTSTGGRRRSASNASSLASQEDQEEENQERAIPLVAVAQNSGPTAKTFAFHKEDHTLGNVLRYVIMQDPKVLAAGYTIPHPLEAFLHIRVETVPGEVGVGTEKTTAKKKTTKKQQQTTKNETNISEEREEEEEEEDGSECYSADEALKTGLKSLKTMCLEARSSFEAAMDEYLAERGVGGR